MALVFELILKLFFKRKITIKRKTEAKSVLPQTIMRGERVMNFPKSEENPNKNTAICNLNKLSVSFL